MTDREDEQGRRLVDVRAYGFAGTFVPREIAETLDGCAVVEDRSTKTSAIASYPDGRFAVVHDFGSIVLFGFSEQDRERAMRLLLPKLPAEPSPPLVDDYSIDVQPDAAPQVTFDRATVSALDVETISVVGLVLAQSVAMDYYDRDLAEMFRRVDALTTRLAAEGRLRGRVRELSRDVGKILVLRTQMATTLSLLDAPLVTWEREPLDRLYRALRLTFEIEDHYRTMQHKLDIIQDDLEVVVDLAQARRSELLEWLVVVLILVELIVGVLRK